MSAPWRKLLSDFLRAGDRWAPVSRLLGVMNATMGPPNRLEGARFVGFIPVRDLAVARDFYVDTLGMTLSDESLYAVVVDAHGTAVRLTQVPDLRPQPFTIAGWEVIDIRQEVDSLTTFGVTFNRYEGMEQDERGIWTTPEGDLVAWFIDPDGNTLSLTSFVRP
jgi:catechol 2,3-dioxygenase-like lactoylglutathione lyase family enzyme